MVHAVWMGHVKVKRQLCGICSFFHIVLILEIELRLPRYARQVPLLAEPSHWLHEQAFSKFGLSTIGQALAVLLKKSLSANGGREVRQRRGRGGLTKTQDA